MTKGFFTITQNNDDTDYVRLAYGLALSLRLSQKEHYRLSIGVTPGQEISERYRWAFDQVVEIPWKDHAENSSWKLENEWKSIYMSPYDETIKLDADMLFFNDISTWWDTLSQHEFMACNKVISYRGDKAQGDFYRKTFAENMLPNIYTAFMYFRKTEYTFAIFNMAKMIYFNWERFFGEFLAPEHRPTYPSTDVIFALALKILDEDQISYTEADVPTFTHMKSKIQGWGEHVDEDWSKIVPAFFAPDMRCRVGNHLQYHPLHYHNKSFLTDDILEMYERRLQDAR